ncbi:hypothetical protein Hypma_004477 [Hypsizygus marmoreus]|uniref:F-box domain-containing protein n=1 Tax=Hypsizygus marmoreus TaxID=39966 RepID=A0A369K5U5_HYPMA|nr:hypothetical protein Hypma_004477 [Hypsizygus marmoreus]
MTPLPQEVLDKVVDELHDDHGALKRCALASRYLLPRSQRHLFSTICLSDDAQSHRLHGVLIVNPFLPRCIHELEMNLSLWKANDVHLPDTLHLMTSLQSLAINDAGLWIRMSRSISDSIKDLVNLPSLVHLSISNADFIPMLFATPKAMKSFQLHGSLSFTDTLAFAVSGMTTELLVLNLHSDMLGIGSQLPALSQVRKLILHSVSSVVPSTLGIMGASADSLEVIEFHNMFPDGIDRENIFTFDFSTLSRLSCFTFTSTFRTELSINFYEKCVVMLEKLCSFVSANPSSARVKNFRIILSTNRTPSPISATWAVLPEFLTASALWRRLDQILDSARGDTDTSFQVDIVLKIPILRRGDLSMMNGMWERGLRSQMPRTSGKGFLACKVVQVKAL